MVKISLWNVLKIAALGYAVVSCAAGLCSVIEKAAKSTIVIEAVEKKD